MNDDVSTKDRILDTAERLFAQHGFDGTSLRAITAEAGVNIAAVNYYFHSKDALIQAVFTRRLGPVNRRRIEWLDELERKYPFAVPLHLLLEALLRPVLEGGRSFRPLLGRLYGEPHAMVKRVMSTEMAEIAQRYGEAFRRTLPDLPPVELAWRLHFVIGALAHTLAASAMLEILSQGACDSSDLDGVIRRMVNFFAAGLLAPERTE